MMPREVTNEEDKEKKLKGFAGRYLEVMFHTGELFADCQDKTD